MHRPITAAAVRPVWRSHAGRLPGLCRVTQRSPRLADAPQQVGQFQTSLSHVAKQTLKGRIFVSTGDHCCITVQPAFRASSSPHTPTADRDLEITSSGSNPYVSLPLRTAARGLVGSRVVVTGRLRTRCHTRLPMLQVMPEAKRLSLERGNALAHASVRHGRWNATVVANAIRLSFCQETSTTVGSASGPEGRPTPEDVRTLTLSRGIELYRSAHPLPR